MNIMSLIDYLLLVIPPTLHLIISTLLNSYWLIIKIYWSFTIDTINFPLTSFWRIITHSFNIDKNAHPSSLSNLHKPPSPLSDKIYQHDGGSKLSIDVISDAKEFRALVNDYLSYTTCSDMSLLNKFVRTIGRHLVTVISLGNTEVLMIKYRPINNT